MTENLNARNFIKRPSSKGVCLVPADVMSEDWLSTLKMDAEILLSVDKPRNPKHHRLLMAMLGLILQNTEQYRVMDDLLSDLKVATGLVERRMNLITQQEYIVAKSIAFSSMKQAEFAEWFELVVALIAINIFKIKKSEVLKQIYDMAREQRKPLTHGKRYADMEDDDASV